MNEYVAIPTICPYCGAGCGMLLEVFKGEVKGVLPLKGHPVSHGELCIKGYSSWEFISNSGRLEFAFIGKGGNRRKASLDEAIDVIAGKLKDVLKESGPEALGFISSAKATNEENYLFQKFARIAGKTNNIDHCARLCHSPTVAGLAAAFGSGAMTNSIGELSHASAILLVGSNTTEQHPVIAGRIIEAIRGGAKLVIIDPRRIQLSEYAQVHLAPKPGYDIACINAMMNVILREGLEDKEFINERTEGFNEFKKSIDNFTPEWASSLSGVPPEDIVEAARIYATSENAAVIYCMGITQHTCGTDNVKALANLAMLTGNVGKPSSGVNPLRGQNNVQGACDMGALPDSLPGYQKVDDEKSRERFENAWGFEIPSNRGLTLVEIIDGAHSGQIRFLFIMGENPVLSDPDSLHVREALEKVEFLVVQDIFETETTELADVVLPAACWAEKDGTFTSTERRVQRIRKVVEPPGDAKADWEIISQIARKLGIKGFEYSSSEEIFKEIAKVVPSYSGITYERLCLKGIQWPCADLEDEGTKFLHKDKFLRGKGKFHVVEFKPPAEVPCDEFPLTLMTGRLAFQYHTGTMSRKSATLESEANKPYIEISAQDAEKYGIKSGENVRVSTRRGSVVAFALITSRVKPGEIFMPFHFHEAPANVLTGRSLDPASKIPELKVCAAKIERA